MHMKCQAFKYVYIEFQTLEGYRSLEVCEVLTYIYHTDMMKRMPIEQTKNTIIDIKGGMPYLHM